MHKKLLYITIILAMVFGAFGLMGPGGVQEAQALDMWGSGTTDDAYQGAGFIWSLDTGSTLPAPEVGGAPGSVLGIDIFPRTRDPITDPSTMACPAGEHTLWQRLIVSNDSGALTDTPRFMSVVVMSEFDAVVLITDDDPIATRTTLGCQVVPADTPTMITVPVEMDNYNLMVANHRSYPLTGPGLEFISWAVMQSRFANPVIVQNIPAATAAPLWRTPGGLDTPVNVYNTIAAPDANGFSFFDVANTGPNHMSWSERIGGQNWVIFRNAVQGPEFISFDPTVTATSEVHIVTDGGLNNYNLWLVPSDLEADTEPIDVRKFHGIRVAGVQNVPPDTARRFQAEPGTYDAMIVSSAGSATPYYMLTIADKTVFNTVLSGFPETLDFRATNHDQATVQFNDNTNFMTTDLLIRPTEALGDWIFAALADEDQIILSTQLATDTILRLRQGGWWYHLNPVFFDGLGATSRTFGADEEVNITIDSGNPLGVAPYNFYSSVAIDNALAFVSMTDYVDAMGNVLTGVFAPDGTFILPIDGFRDPVEPNIRVEYSQAGNNIVNVDTWDLDDIAIPDLGIGRYRAIRSLVTGPRVNAFTYQAFAYTRPGDVPLTHWSWPWVMRMFELDLTAGIGDGLYGTENIMLRQEMAVFLAGLLTDGNVTADMVAPDFADLGQASEWARDSIQFLRDLGVTEGCSAEENLFCPMDPVSRAEVAPFILKTFRLLETFNPGTYGGHWDQGSVDQSVFFPGTTFVDLPLNHWANIWVEEMANQGLTDGCRTEMSGDVTIHYYCPEDPVTRGAMAIFVVGALEPAGTTQGFWPVLSPER